MKLEKNAAGGRTGALVAIMRGATHTGMALQFIEQQDATMRLLFPVGLTQSWPCTAC